MTEQETGESASTADRPTTANEGNASPDGPMTFKHFLENAHPSVAKNISAKNISDPVLEALEGRLTILVVKIKRLVPAPTQGGFDLKWFLQTKSGGRVAARSRTIRQTVR
jgi:hypothetical protein